MQEVQTLTFADPQVQACPFPHYDKIREETSAYFDAAVGMYVVTRYEDVVKVLKNHQVFSSQTGLIQTRSGEELQRLYEAEGVVPIPTLLNNDPPDHRKYRSLVDKAFTAKRVQQLEPYVRDNVIDLLRTAIGHGGKIDMMGEFAVRLPLTVISDLAGMPREMNDQMIIWADAGIESTNPLLTPERELELARHTVAFQQYFISRAAELKAKPDGTVLSNMIQIGVDGREVTDAEIVSLMQILMVAGYETTASALGSAIAELCRHPDLQNELRAVPDRIPAFVEEILRVYSPLQGLFRIATEDTQIGDVDIPSGSIVMVRYGAANRDPAKFAEPGKLDLCRGNARSNVAFGFGIHLCVGNILARSELRIAIEELLIRSTNLSLVNGESSWEHKPSFITWGPQHLWIDITPA